MTDWEKCDWCGTLKDENERCSCRDDPARKYFESTREHDGVA